MFVAPPGANGGTQISQVYTTSLSTAATNVLVYPAGLPEGGAFVVLQIITPQAGLATNTGAYVRFGLAGIGAATTSDWFFPNNRSVTFRLSKENAAFSALAEAGGGNPIIQRYLVAP